MTSLHNFARKSLVFFFAITGAGLFAPAPTSAQPAPKVTLLVKTARGLTQAQGQAALRGHGGAIKKSIPKVDLHVIEVPAQAADAITKAMKADSKNIARVETEWTRKAQGIPSDTLYPTQWALPKIGWDQVYGTVTPGTWTRVAILDTGVEGSHPDFAGVLAPGTSIIDGSDGLTDTNGHGTWLAGIVAARTNNGLGIAGVGADFVQVMPVKVLDANGEGQDSDVIAGLIWAVDNGAKVVLMAFSNPGFSESLQEAIDYAWSKDVVLIAAAGNTGDATPTFPAGDRGVMGVSATDEQDQLAGSSTFGPSAFIAAPGTNIAGTALSSAYTQRSGTSAAAAMVAGAAAYLRAVDPALTNGVIVNRLAKTAEAAGTQQQTGNGRLQIARALADTSTVSIQPAGADPVGTGGPFVGPYVAAAVNVQVYEGTCSTATASFNLSATVCARATGLGNETHHFEWFNPSNTLKKTSGNSSSGSFNDTYVPDSIGAWTVKVIKNAGSVVVETRTFMVTGKSSQTITFGALASKTYGDADFNVSATASSGLTVTFSATGQCTVNGTTVHITAAGSCTIIADQAGDASYNPAPSVQQTFTISQAATTTMVTCTAGPFTYTGSAQTPCTATVTGAGGLNESMTVSYTDNVNAGTATASATYAGTTNYLGSSGSKTFTIGKAGTTTTVTCTDGPFTYTGAAQTPCTATVTGVGALNESLAVSYTDNVNAGTATASVTYAGTTNYLGSSGSKTFAIGKAGTTTTVTCTVGPFTYTGAAQTPCTATVTGAGALNESLTVNYTDNVNAGTATASATYAATQNYLTSSDSKTFTIGKAATTTTMTCGAGPFTYTGSAQTPCSATVTGAGSLSQSVTVSYTNNVNAGTATASATYAESTNHLSSTDSKTFIIGKAVTTTTVTCTGAPFTYNGSPQTPCSATVSGVGGLNQSVAVSYTNNVNAGTGSASATYAESANHLGSTGANTFIINKAATLTTVICPTTQQPYSGSPLTPCTATVIGAVLNMPLTVLYTNNTNPGTATASAGYAESANHLGSIGSNTFTIYNVTPVVIISAPVSGTVVPVGTTVTFKGTSTDTVGDVPTSAIWTFDTLTQAVTPLTQDAAGLTDLTTTFKFTTAGVYKVKLTVIDGIGGTTGTGVGTQVGGVDLLVVVYDPSAGFVTGGGWIDSAPGASLQFPDAVGKANFGFVSKYHKGATVPTGETEFQFKAGNLNFNSTRYDWLVLNGGTGMAQYKGSGTVNGVAGYTFMLTARDGDLQPTRPKDGIRMKIADSSGNVVYDNMRSKIDDDNNGANTQDLGGGSIQIHQSK